ncbi:uncharacterized protein LOC130733305 [Lotus japonicus]|uniref:uncharacterized protein LOC130733305 n=1 Tax=Lotus japonicus TaxID=34305 RepID=UPI002590680B|nr:uncharacterized protein LOC130733305 [Lotus japonicus]
MGNAACFQCNNNTNSTSSSVKLIFWEGTARSLKGRHIAGEIMFEFPDMMVCHADSFFIGHPIPALSIDDQLMPGQTYFVIPLDLLSSDTLSVSSLSSFGGGSSSSPSNNINKSPIKFGSCPFQYLKGSDGRVLIKVMPEFITSLINKGISNNNGTLGSGSPSSLCSTPELQKHYEQLVKSKNQVWSPKLETISEYKIRFSVSPCRYIGTLEWKEKEKSEDVLTR